MADIGTITGTLELNTERFTGSARDAEATLARIDAALAATGESADQASTRLATLPSALGEINTAASATGSSLQGADQAIAGLGQSAAGTAGQLAPLPAALQETT